MAVALPPPPPPATPWQWEESHIALWVNAERKRRWRGGGVAGKARRGEAGVAVSACQSHYSATNADPFAWRPAAHN